MNVQFKRNLGCGVFSAPWINAEKTSDEKVSDRGGQEGDGGANRRRSSDDRDSDGGKFSEKIHF